MFRKRSLFLWHRWLGIGAGALFIMWFVSGMIMMYSWYPAITGGEKFARLKPINLAACRVSPRDALQRAGVGGEATVRLGMSGNRPLYRIKPDGKPWRAVWADSGKPMVFSRELGERAAREYSRAGGAPRFLGLAARDDQWAGRAGQQPYHPLQKWGFNDGAGSELYVSERTGEIVQRTTRWGRYLSYPGTLVHLLEPVQLDDYPVLRVWIIAVGSGIGVLLIVTGLWIGVLRWKREGYARRDGTRPKSPYRGTQRWHHYAGLTFGFFALTWVGSGFLYILWPLSDYPSSAQNRAFTGAWNIAAANAPPAQLNLEENGFAAPREAELVHFDGRPYWIFAASQHQSRTIRADGTGRAFTQFPEAELRRAVQTAMPGVAMHDFQTLRDFDFYYYSRQNFRVKRLPIVRARFADAQALWIYADPHSGQIEYAITRGDRAFRWVFRALHSFDFPGLINSRPLWDVLMLFFGGGGLWLSTTGVLLGWRRMRSAKAAAHGAKATPVTEKVEV